MFYGSEQLNCGVGLSLPNSSHSPRYMGDQTFHTPNFGDEEFDIPPISLPTDPQAQSNIHYATMMGHGNEQQQQTHYAQMYLPEHQHNMTTHSGVSYGGSPPTYTTLSSPQAHLLQAQMGTRPPGRAPNNNTSPTAHTEPTSEDSNDSNTHPQMVGGKRRSPEPPVGAPKKAKPQKKKKKRDPNEPQKPVSAYALFFRDTQAAIKGQNPNASFGEVSKIVASMWDALEADHKNVYKKKTEAAKKEYLKALAAYRASLVSKGAPTDSVDGSGMYPPGFNASLQAQTQPTQHHHYAPQNYYSGQKKGGQGPVQGQTQSSPQHQPTHTPIHHHLGDNQYRQTHYTQMGEGMVQGGQAQAQQQQVIGQERQGGGQVCLRSTCTNGSIPSHDWDEEYCSADCVVTHCRDVFTNWVSSNQGNSGTYHAGAVPKFAGPGNGVAQDGLSYAT